MTTPGRQLNEEVEDQLKAAYDMLKVDRSFGSADRKEMSKWVLAFLSDYWPVEVIERNRSKFAKRDKILGRYHYIRAAALWFSGSKDAAREEYEKAIKMFGSCDEKEMCDGVGLSRP